MAAARTWFKILSVVSCSQLLCVASPLKVAFC